MDNHQWLEMWERAEIGFHLDGTHPLLVRHWPAMQAPDGARVLVPLCGKTRDMLFLRSQGCAVTGIELSGIAIRQFFEEQHLVPRQARFGTLASYETDGVRLIEGDFFAAEPSLLGPMDLVYDRAALIAMPPDRQPRYADHLMALAGGAPILLITLDYNPAEMNGPPFATPPAQIERLFGDRYRIECLESSEVLAENPGLRNRGLTALTETTWRLQPR